MRVRKTKTKECPRCREELAEDDILCPSCGLHIEATEDLDAVSDEQDP